MSLEMTDVADFIGPRQEISGGANCSVVLLVTLDIMGKGESNSWISGETTVRGMELI